MADLLPYSLRINAITNALKGAFLKEPPKSATSVYNRISGTSLGIRTQTFYQLAASVKEQTDKIKAFWEYPRNQPITPKIALKAAAKIGVVYSFSVHVAAYDINNRYLYDTYKTVNTKAYRTKEEVLSIFPTLQGSPKQEEQKWIPYDVVEARYHGE